MILACPIPSSACTTSPRPWTMPRTTSTSASRRSASGSSRRRSTSTTTTSTTSTTATSAARPARSGRRFRTRAGTCRLASRARGRSWPRRSRCRPRRSYSGGRASQRLASRRSTDGRVHRRRPRLPRSVRAGAGAGRARTTTRATPWTSTIGEESAIRGLHSVTLVVRAPEHTLDLMTTVLGCSVVDEGRPHPLAVNGTGPGHRWTSCMMRRPRRRRTASAPCTTSRWPSPPRSNSSRSERNWYGAASR